MFRKIVLAYDGSEPAERAFAQILRSPECAGCDLAIVSVIRATEFALDVAAQTALDCAVASLASQQATLEQRARMAGIQTTVVICLGHPAREVLRAANGCSAELIVTGQRPRRPLTRWLMGSVSREITARAHCPVLVVH